MVPLLPVILILAQAGAATPPPCPPVYIAVERDGTQHVLTGPMSDAFEQVRLYLPDGTSILMDKERLDVEASQRAINSASGCPVGINEVVQVPGKTADQLYSAALAWVPVTFKSTKGVTELADRASGMIVLKGREEWSLRKWGFPATGHVSYKVTIEMKKGRYRYAIDSFSDSDYGAVTDSPTPPALQYEPGPKIWSAMQQVARETTGLLSASLKLAMEKQSDNW